MVAAPPYCGAGVFIRWQGKNTVFEVEQMRNATRRKQDVWFVVRTKDDSDIVPAYTYSKPEKHRMSVSPTSGSPAEMNFGLLPTYDRYMISYDRDFQPTEGMYLYVDKTPEIDDEGDLVLDGNEPTVKPDYILDRIYDTKKGVLARYGITKVSDRD
mgnify:CR=1 FL=1